MDRHGSYSYTYDALHRLLAASTPLPSPPLESFTYDPVGNRLDSHQNGVSRFNYDALGRRVEKAAISGATTVNE